MRFYWYAVALRANGADHQRAIVQWAQTWEPSAYARQTTFPVDIQPRSLDRRAKVAR